MFTNASLIKCHDLRKKKEKKKKTRADTYTLCLYRRYYVHYLYIHTLTIVIAFFSLSLSLHPLCVCVFSVSLSILMLWLLYVMLSLSLGSFFRAQWICGSRDRGQRLTLVKIFGWWNNTHVLVEIPLNITKVWIIIIFCDMIEIRIVSIRYIAVLEIIICNCVSNELFWFIAVWYSLHDPKRSFHRLLEFFFYLMIKITF